MQRATARRRRSTTTATTSAASRRRSDWDTVAIDRNALTGDFPVGGGIALPRPLDLVGRRRRLAREMQQSRLRAGVELELQRGVVLPGDVHAPGHPHDVADPVRFARQAARLVLGQVPCVGDASALVVDRHAGVIALGRRQHSPAPVFGDERYPVTGDIDRCDGPRRPGRCGWRRWLPCGSGRCGGRLLRRGGRLPGSEKSRDERDRGSERDVVLHGYSYRTTGLPWGFERSL